MTEMKTIDRASLWYENQPWLRALAQLPPGGGSVDVLLSHRATKLNQQRLESLLHDVSLRLAEIDNSKLNKKFIESDDFFEIFRRCAEIAAHTASDEKRKLVAEYLSGTVEAGVANDITGQLLEDLNNLQPFHLQLIAGLPSEPAKSIDRDKPPAPLQVSMSPDIYRKGLADLERFGFLWFNNGGIGMFGGVSGHWETTHYLVLFKETFNPKK